MSIDTNNIDFLIQAHQRLESRIEKLSDAMEAIGEKQLKASETNTVSLHHLSDNIIKLSERDKIQNKRLEHLEKQLNHHDQILKLGIGGGVVLLSLLKILGIPL
ncbi:MAG: hypothetical protein ACRC0X_06025 [Brevinema sp.]